jgi:hypothetical protein
MGCRSWIQRYIAPLSLRDLPPLLSLPMTSLTERGVLHCKGTRAFGRGCGHMPSEIESLMCDRPYLTKQWKYIIRQFGGIDILDSTMELITPLDDNQEMWMKPCRCDNNERTARCLQ